MAITLTFPGASDVVAAIHDELAKIYRAVPPKINVYDEPAGDFGIAHFYGLDRNTAQDDDFLLTFDVGRIPTRYVVCHELGHALDLNVSLQRGGDPFSNGLYEQFWDVRGFTRAYLAPKTPMEAQHNAMAAAFPASYRLWPSENFADAFGAINSYGQGTLITETYGAALDEPALRAFYKSLKGAFDMLDDEDIERISRSVANRILPEVLAKIDSGFNTTLTTVANRVVAGDKDTATAELDK